MQDDNQNNKLMTVEDAAAALDLRRDYDYGQGYGRGVYPNEGAETHLRDYWRIVRRRLWVPIAVVIIVVTLTTIYNLRLPSIYEGVTKIEIDREDRVVNLKDLQINMGGGDDQQYVNTQLKILQSPRIAYRVAKTLNLEHNPAFLGIAPTGDTPSGQGEKIEISSGQSDERAEMERLEGYTGMLLGNVEIRPVRDTRLVEIHYRHPRPELARNIADAWAEVFKTDSLEKRYEANKDSARFLEKNIAEYKLKLREAEEKLLNYRRTNQVLDFGEKESTVTARLAALNQLLLQAETERKNLQTAYDLSRNAKDPSTIPEIQRDPMVQDLNRKLTDLRQQRERLLAEYTPEWPEVKAIDQQLAKLDEELRTSQQRIVGTIENQYKAAVEKENSLRASFGQQHTETLKQNEGAITARMLLADRDSTSEMLNRLLQSQQGVEVSAAGLLKSNIRVTENAPLPRTPVAPKRAQNIVISFILALLGGVGLVLFLDYVNNKIESVEDIDRYLHLSALGVIPVVEAPKARKLLGRDDDEADNRGLMRINAAGNVLLTEVEATSSVAESYRQLRTSLLLSTAGRPPRTLLVTSSQPAEGKTTTSVNTAISLAQTGASVLIVDADLRRPRVHKIFNLKNHMGLSNYLAGDCDLASLVQIALPNLYVLPVGPLPPNPAELLGSARMKQAIETLAGNFDHVVIDSPPVASFADSLILSALVEGVIIVVRGGVTPREMAQRTKAHLQSVGAHILGVVINQVKLQPHDYYYYSTHYSRYYYGRGDDDRTEAGDGARADD